VRLVCQFCELAIKFIVGFSSQRTYILLFCNIVICITLTSLCILLCILYILLLRIIYVYLWYLYIYTIYNNIYLQNTLASADQLTHRHNLPIYTLTIIYIFVPIYINCPIIIIWAKWAYCCVLYCLYSYFFLITI